MAAMARGKTHALATVTAAGVSGLVLVILAGVPISQAAALMAGCFAGLLITPDLDVEQRVHAAGLVRRAGGGVLGGLWRLFWWPYARLIPHRHPLSHGPVIGTLVRLVYMLAVPVLLWWLVGQFVPLPHWHSWRLTPLV
jgi:uncharacterized metal-binding protein